MVKEVLSHYENVMLILILWLSVGVTSIQYCHDGTYEIVRPDGIITCDPCPEGTYMPDYDHRQTACYNCNKTESHLERVYSPCTKTHDTVIHCVEGYYRDLPRNPREKATCKKCTECQNAGRPCQTYSDTICCMHENSEVVTHKDGYLTCKERPYLCRNGQYMDTSVNECLPCPGNTFMPLDYHVMTKCWECPQYNLPLHAKIIQPCNSTHAPVVACKKGFYMNNAMGYKDSSIGCSPCTDCSQASLYEGRACDGVHDTVCCLQPNMEVRDGIDGPVCEQPLWGRSTQLSVPTEDHPSTEFKATVLNVHTTTYQSPPDTECPAECGPYLILFIIFISLFFLSLLMIIVLLYKLVNTRSAVTLERNSDGGQKTSTNTSLL